METGAGDAGGAEIIVVVCITGADTGCRTMTGAAGVIGCSVGCDGNGLTALPGRTLIGLVVNTKADAVALGRLFVATRVGPAPFEAAPEIFAAPLKPKVLTVGPFIPIWGPVMEPPLTKLLTDGPDMLSVTEVALTLPLLTVPFPAVGTPLPIATGMDPSSSLA